MKTKLTLVLAASLVILLEGCGGGGGEAPDADPQANRILENDFAVQLCTSETHSDTLCQEALQFDLEQNTVAVLSVPEDIGTSRYFYFDGKRLCHSLDICIVCLLEGYSLLTK